MAVLERVPGMSIMIELLGDLLLDILEFQPKSRMVDPGTVVNIQRCDVQVGSIEMTDFKAYLKILTNIPNHVTKGELVSVGPSSGQPWQKIAVQWIIDPKAEVRMKIS